MSRPPNRVPLQWRDLSADSSGGGSPLKIPYSTCWREQTLVVVDRRLAQLVFFSANGRVLKTVGSQGSDAGQFGSPTVVRCSDGVAAFLTADLALHRLTFWDSAGRVIRIARTPPVPQIDILGEFALDRSGEWYDSWLGSDVTFGPYLSDEQWRNVSLVRRYGADDTPLDGLGSTVPYEDPVARRIFNRVFLTISKDTLWTLTQGDATIRGFTRSGASAGTPIVLPVYFRGMDPEVKVDAAAKVPQSDFLPNSLTYDPNVQGVAVVQDSLFATIRYRDWGMKLVRSPSISLQRFAESSIEILNRHGEVLRAYDLPGMGLSIDSDGKDRISVISRMRDNTRRVLVTRLPRK